jgi:uncharacterized protein YgiM (DUF1202 family)
LPEKAHLIPLLAILVVISCAGGEQPVVDRPEFRDAIAIRYVVPADLEVRLEPRLDSPVVATFATGESVSVLEDRNGWSEVRLVGQTGWVETVHIVDSREGFVSTPEQVRFRTAPVKVPDQISRGELVYEASVNSEGIVTSVRTVKNTTGSASLEMRNRQSLLNARFFPMVIDGRATDFKYEYRVIYQ